MEKGYINPGKDRFTKINIYLMLSMLAILSLASSDIYIPLIREVSNDLNTHTSFIQFSISLYFLGLGAGQIVYGSLVEHFGFKQVFFLSMLLYILGCIFCAQSESISPFLIGRFLQALGACAALVSWQPMLIQIFPPIKAKSIGSLLFILMCLSPGAAPIIGAYSASLFSWKICFHFLAGYAILLSVLVYFYAPQFKVTSKDSYSLFTTFKALFSNKTYMKLLLLISSCNSGYLTYLVAYPLLVSSNTNEAVELGLQFIPIAISFSLGAILGKKLIQKNESYKIIQQGILLYLISVGILLLTLTFAVITNPWLQILPSFCLLVFANGLLLPVASMEAILASGGSTYSASGLIGASRMLIAFIATSLLSFSSQYSLSTGLLGILILTSFVNFKYSLKERT